MTASLGGRLSSFPAGGQWLAVPPENPKQEIGFSSAVGLLTGSGQPGIPELFKGHQTFPLADKLVHCYVPAPVR